MARRQRLDFGGNNLALAAGATDHVLTHIISQLAAGDLSWVVAVGARKPTQYLRHSITI